MFYCNACGTERGWPVGTLMRSRGVCEICNRPWDCNDVPSSELPVPDMPATSLPRIPVTENRKEPAASSTPNTAAEWRTRVSALMVRVSRNQRDVARLLTGFAESHVTTAEHFSALAEIATQQAEALAELTTAVADEPKEATDVPA